VPVGPRFNVCSFHDSCAILQKGSNPKQVSDLLTSWAAWIFWSKMRTGITNCGFLKPTWEIKTFRPFYIFGIAMGVAQKCELVAPNYRNCPHWMSELTPNQSVQIKIKKMIRFRLRQAVYIRTAKFDRKWLNFTPNRLNFFVFFQKWTISHYLLKFPIFVN